MRVDHKQNGIGHDLSTHPLLDDASPETTSFLLATSAFSRDTFDIIQRSFIILRMGNNWPTGHERYPTTTARSSSGKCASKSQIFLS